MLDLIYSQEISKAGRKILIGGKIYERTGFTLGINFQHGIAVLAGVLYFPPEGQGLLHDSKSYPINERIVVLKSRHGDDWLDRYVPPRENHYDVMGELTFLSMTKLKDELARLTNVLSCRMVCSNAENDFAYQIGGVIPVIGDRPYLLSHANQILAEERCECSNACKRVLSREEPALLALGCALSSLEKNFYDFTSSHSEAREMSLSASYT